ncbi:uncharacterized protein LOC126723693 [Quercus robur]|uniref:uncharacterized protein LOC126723693 n=1 Tax=Quercus robur TaxID=38942 RepID=UPI002161E447|nr:uncharacterized protein LOC126723693 [Quercus robur]
MDQFFLIHAENTHRLIKKLEIARPVHPCASCSLLCERTVERNEAVLCSDAHHKTHHNHYSPPLFSSKNPNTITRITAYPFSHSPKPRSLSIINSANESNSLSPKPGQFRVDVLSESLPFIQKFRGKTIVVKYGGAAMKSQALQASVVNDLVLLACVGLRPVLVHGGGPEINLWLKRLNIEAVRS